MAGVPACQHKQHHHTAGRQHGCNGAKQTSRTSMHGNPRCPKHTVQLWALHIPMQSDTPFQRSSADVCVMLAYYKHGAGTQLCVVQSALRPDQAHTSCLPLTDADASWIHGAAVSHHRVLVECDVRLVTRLLHLGTSDALT